MKKRISVLLCAVMLVSLLAGCGGGDNLTGTWEATVDKSETIGAGIKASLTEVNPDLEQYINITDTPVVIRTTFNEDGTYVSEITEESFAAMMDSMATQVAAGFVSYAEALKAQMKKDIDINTILGIAEGTTIEAEIKKQFNAEDFKKIIAESAQSGVYKAKDGKLYTAENQDSFDENKFETYVLNGDTLEITGLEGMDEEAVDIMTNIYPITYKKITQTDAEAK